MSEYEFTCFSNERDYKDAQELIEGLNDFDMSRIDKYETKLFSRIIQELENYQAILLDMDKADLNHDDIQKLTPPPTI